MLIDYEQLVCEVFVDRLVAFNELECATSRRSLGEAGDGGNDPGFRVAIQMARTRSTVKTLCTGNIFDVRFLSPTGAGDATVFLSSPAWT